MNCRQAKSRTTHAETRRRLDTTATFRHEFSRKSGETVGADDVQQPAGAGFDAVNFAEMAVQGARADPTAGDCLASQNVKVPDVAHDKGDFNTQRRQKIRALPASFSNIAAQRVVSATKSGLPTPPEMPKPPPEKGIAGLSVGDYYLDDRGLVVFTAAYHLKRGYCCKSGCRHCPYGFEADARRHVGFDEFKTP